MKRFDLAICGAELVTGSGVERADIGILDGKIAEIGSISPDAAAESIDAKGLHCFAGFIDTQVHFREPGLEHKENLESGSRAALAGGVTAFLEMPNTLPPTTTAEALQDKLDRCQGRIWSNAGFFVGAATDNIDQLGALETAPGSAGIKLFMGSSTGTLLVPDDGNVLGVLQNGMRRVPVHSEDAFRLKERAAAMADVTDPAEHPNIRDAECARLCTERLLRLAKTAGRPVHVLHVSTADELPLLRGAKAAGQDVTCEITPQHLWFAAPEAYERLGTLAQMNPPIRTAAHRDALRQAVMDGLFDVFGSDHAPHTLEEKAKPYPQSPSGMPGVQTVAPAALTLIRELDLMDLPTFARMLCERPAELYDIQGKGRIAIGFDADLALFDLTADWTFERKDVVSKCGWSPYEGERFTARPILTALGGRVAWREGTFVGQPSGQILRFQ